MPTSPELILSLPPRMQTELAFCAPEIAERAFFTHDPPATQLGSGGGTAYALAQAWQSGTGLPATHLPGSSLSPQREPTSFLEWTRQSQRIVIHGGGESRRLPAYAAVGKLFLPIPTLRWSRGERLGQTLLDLNEPFLKSVFEQANPNARLMIASGDVLLRSEQPIAPLPDADIVLMGTWVTPEDAQNYGVMFVDRHEPQRLLTFLQKPSPNEIRERSRDCAFLMDIGVWLLSDKAIACLMAKCGWDESKSEFACGSTPASYDLYGQWALHLGASPESRDSEISELTVAVAPVPQGQFYHFGKTSDVIESIYQLQTLVRDPTQLGAVSSLAQPRQFIQDSLVGVPIRREENESLWVENSYVPATWNLASRHMITGVPPNDWALDLPEGICLDFMPIEEDSIAVRPYGYTDAFRGAIDDDKTQWLERPVSDWFSERGITWTDANLQPDTDIQRAALFPLMGEKQLTGDFVQWMIRPTSSPTQNDLHRTTWIDAKRLSAREMAQSANIKKQTQQRIKLRKSVMPLMAAHGAKSIFYKLDLADAAKIFASSEAPTPQAIDQQGDLMLSVHSGMFRSEVLKHRNEPSWKEAETTCFQKLETAIVQPYRNDRVVPDFRLADDQIVWGRSPVRVDLAGGWTDTPPYCMEQGGSVVNIGLDLNGQPPIQAFARRCKDRTITIRSIDLGVSETLTTYNDVAGYRGIGSGFSVAKAALALCGFHPDFNGEAFPTLAAQLEQFGGGVDLSMLAAVPKGSGLGTSSILSGTVLGALNELGSLGWDSHELAARVSAVEQMLGSGGGWQDQFGGLHQGAKLIQTQPGLGQKATLRWLPNDFFETPEFQSRALLYYTGITRVANDLLAQIVRGMFLNDQNVLNVLSAIGENSIACSNAIQLSDIDSFANSVKRSWELNQQLDSGTNPPSVAELVHQIEPFVTAMKLAGAGGGGFFYLIAKDADRAQRLRAELENNPPNRRARFVDMSVSKTGLCVTRS